MSLESDRAQQIKAAELSNQVSRGPEVIKVVFLVIATVTPPRR